jgi:hypothetical protein
VDVTWSSERARKAGAVWAAAATFKSVIEVQRPKPVASLGFRVRDLTDPHFYLPTDAELRRSVGIPN